LQWVLSILEFTAIFLGVVAFGVGFYYIHAFHWLWREHMRSRGLGEFTIARLSPYAVFSRDLPERCNVQRRKLLLAVVAFFVFLGTYALILAAEKSLGFVNQ
jgi:hypothetical protein